MPKTIHLIQVNQDCDQSCINKDRKGRCRHPYVCALWIARKQAIEAYWREHNGSKDSN